MKRYISIIIILLSTSLYAQCQGDMNSDGIINVVDIVAQVNLIMSGDAVCEEEPSVHGCLDSQACNYSPNALIDNNSCIYPDCDDSCNNENAELGGICYNVENTTSLNYGNSADPNYIPNDGLYGEIPPEIGNLTNLTYLNLNNSNVTGEIPPEIGNLTNLTYLSLWGNELTGEIPSSLGNLINLTELYLHYNNLIGEIPQELCDLIESNNLWMSYILQENNIINTCED